MKDNFNTDKIKEMLKNTKVNDVSISKELETSFMDYAMSVITSRALPDVRDGLKPVHRRILFAAYNLGMTNEKPYKKSARLVGEVIGKYHPHGDSAVYEAIVRMAQDFSLRYPLIDGHGNFGSIDGDGAAAMRYTEVKLSKISNEMLVDIEKNTISFVENYDGTELEPTILPCLFPNLLANGSSGIAVGMSTNIPPHNLSELINASVFLTRNPDATIDELMEYVKGPDFPTYGNILGDSGIISYFKTGKGTISIRSNYEIINHDSNRSSIIINELPYFVNKANLIEKIANLVKEEIITGISDLRDETSRDGIRVVIDLKKDVIPEVILNKLFKSTELQSNMSINIIALVNGEPKQLNLKEILNYYIENLIKILINKIKYNLDKAKAREHILEGLFIAINNIDDIIELIKKSKSNDDAEQELSKIYALSQEQAKAILDMRLRSLSMLEKTKIENELEDLRKKINDWTSILNSEDRQRDEVCLIMENIKNKYGDERKTKIIYGINSDISDEDLIPVEDVVITMSKNGYLKRLPIDSYRTQNRGTSGSKSVITYEDDNANIIINTSTHSDLLFFTDKGKVYRIRAHQVPKGSKQTKGIPAINLINIDSNEKIFNLLSLKDYSDGYLFMTTKKGLVKRVNLSEFSSIRNNGKIAITLREDDELFSAYITSGNDDIFIGSSNGYVCRFNENDLRSVGRTAAGVRGIKLLNDNDYVVGSSSTNSGKYVFSVGELGLGKISNIDLYRKTKRGGKGVKSLRLNNKTGKMVFIQIVNGSEEILILTSEGKVNRISLSSIPEIGRATSGVKLINLNENTKVLSISVINSSENNSDLVSEE